MGRAFFGIILIFLGLVYLGVTTGIFNWAVWEKIWRLWPLILIGIGISMVSQNRTAKTIMMIIFILALCFGLWTLWRESSDQPGSSVDQQAISESLQSGVDAGSLTVKVGASTINLSGPSENGKFIVGQLESRGIRHTWTTSTSGTTQKAEIATNGISAPFIGVKSLVDLQLTNAIPLDIRLDVGGVNATLDFSQVKARSVTIDAGASNITLTYGPNLAEATAKISAGASNITIQAPEPLAVKIKSDSGLSATSFEGLEKVDDATYASKGFDQGEKKLTVTISSGVSSLTFKRTP